MFEKPDSTAIHFLRHSFFFCQSGSLQGRAESFTIFLTFFSFLTSISGWTWAYGHG